MMNIFGTNKDNQLSSHVSNLIAVALSDGTLDAKEWEQIVAIAAQRGIPEKDLEEFRLTSSEASFQAPADFTEKIRQVFELVEVMMADGQIDEGELEICRKLALRYNLHPRIVTDMLDRIPELLAEGKPAQEIISEIVNASS